MSLNSFTVKQNAIFSMFYISAVSAALFLAGDQMTLHDDYPDYDIYDVPDYFKILFAGGFMIIFFWVSNPVIVIYVYTCVEIVDILYYYK